MLIDLGRQCKALRQHKGISLDKMVVLSGFSQPTISAFENGKRNVTLLFLEGYMKALKMDFELVHVNAKGRKGKPLQPGRRRKKPVEIHPKPAATKKTDEELPETSSNENDENDESWW